VQARPALWLVSLLLLQERAGFACPFLLSESAKSRFLLFDASLLFIGEMAACGLQAGNGCLLLLCAPPFLSSFLNPARKTSADTELPLYRRPGLPSSSQTV
jgi:hypothetical protein